MCIKQCLISAGCMYRKIVNLNTRENIRPRGYKTFFMLNSTKHNFSTAHKKMIPTNKEVSCFKPLRCCIYHANKCLNANNCWHFNICEQDKFRAELS